MKVNYRNKKSLDYIMEIKVEIPKGKKIEWKKVDGNLALVLVDEEPAFSIESIKTFADACTKLGINADAFNVCDGGDPQAQRQAQALYKLMIIQKAINNGVWCDEDGWSYYPYWVLYSKEEMERMTEKEKQRKGIKQLLSCALAGYTGDSGVRWAAAVYRGAATGTDYGFPLCYNSKEAALYAARQFESLFFDYYGIKIR